MPGSRRGDVLVLVAIERLNANPHPAAANDLRCALGAYALIDARPSVAATPFAALEPEMTRTNLVGLLAHHDDDRVRPIVGPVAWERARATSPRDVAQLLDAELRSAAPDAVTPRSP